LPINKLIPLQNIHSIIQKFKNENRCIVWTNGCFDILHVGHVEYLQQAKQLGDILIVGLNSDYSVSAIKGANRPIFNELDRARVLNAIIYIDYITIFDNPSPASLLALLKPDFYVKGGDYTLNTIDQEERKIVESYDGSIKILPLIENVSTSAIIKKITQL